MELIPNWSYAVHDEYLCRVVPIKSLQSTVSEALHGYKAINNRCCAWVSVAVAVVLAAHNHLLLLPRLQHAPLLPQHRIKVSKDKSGDSTVMANVTVRYNATNNNDKISFFYSQMKAAISLDGVHLDWSEVTAFRQRTHNATKLQLRSVVKNMYIEEADGDNLLSNSKRHLLTVDVTLVGYIDYRVGGSRVSGCPFKVMCQQAPQPVLDSGVGYGCNIRLSPLKV